MESIRILQDTYEKLYAITPPLGDLIEKELRALSPQFWRDDYVTRIFQKKGFLKDDWAHLYEIDSYYLLEILREYWRDFSTYSESRFFTKENWDLFVNKKNKSSIISIRNEVSHPEYWNYEISTYNAWHESLEKAAVALGSSLPELLYELHEPERKKILDIILNRVVNPALQSTVLPPEILKSIEDTKNRLEMQNTASGIMAFFTDALHSERGKQIYEAFEKHGMASFESIKDEVQKAYYGTAHLEKE
ncbi:MAG: hypothetical protein J1E07_05695 [Treponema sp.]|nr:hypothetical protein [Treponema sp.]